MARRLVVWSGLALAFGCSGSGTDESSPSSSTRDAFVRYWADSDEWCARQTTCVGIPKADCSESWPSPAEVREGLDLAKLDDAAIERCDDAVRALDACYLAMPCASWEAGAPECRSQQERFDIDCAALVSAFESLANGSNPSPQ